MIRNLILSLAFFSSVVTIGAQTPQQKFQVEFVGGKVFSSDVLLKKLNLCVAKYPESQDEYDSNLYQYCLQKDVLDFLRSEGYLSAKISEPKIQKTEQNLKVTFPVEEGMPYRLGTVNIQGAKVFTSEQLLEKLKLKTGDIADGRELREWLFERVNRLYGNEGYIESSFDLEPRFRLAGKSQNQGIADLEVAVNEGRCFSIDRIEFTGNKQTSDQVLRSQLLIKEDEPFSQRRYEQSIEKLNESGLFERIDKDRDVQILSDAETPLLKINIRVKEKTP